MLYPVELRALSLSLCLVLLPVLTNSASRCTMLASTLRVTAPATRWQARGVRAGESMLSLYSALTRLSYGR